MAFNGTLTTAEMVEFLNARVTALESYICASHQQFIDYMELWVNYELDSDAQLNATQKTKIKLLVSEIKARHTPSK